MSPSETYNHESWSVWNQLKPSEDSSEKRLF